MAKKLIFTDSEIEKDIISAIKRPADRSQNKGRKRWLFDVGALVVLFVLGVVYPKLYFLIFIAILLIMVVGSILFFIHRKKTIKKVSIDDYYLTYEIVHSIDEEHYVKGRYNRYERYEEIDIYTLRFDSGKVWNISKDNYLWSEERPMSDFAIFQSAHRGDRFIVVSGKDTHKVAMAYDTEFFEYKGTRLK